MKRTFKYDNGTLTVTRFHDGLATTEKKYVVSFNEVWFVSFLRGNFEALSGYYFPLEASRECKLVTLLDPRMEAEFRVPLVEIATFTKPAFERLKDADEFERAWDLFYKIQDASYAAMKNEIGLGGINTDAISLTNEHIKLRAQIALGYGEND